MNSNFVRDVRVRAAFLLLGSIALFLLSKNMRYKIHQVVDSSYTSYAFQPNSSLSQRLNHANTYYWYARYRKNAQPEFQKALAISEQIVREIQDSVNAQPLKSDSYRSLEQQAKTLGQYCREQSDVSQLNIASYVPFYLEMMGHDESFMEQDCEAEEVETRAANRAIDVLLELTAPEKNAKIGDRPLFAIVEASGESKAIHESIIQKLNAESKFYTVSDHELVKILGEGATYSKVFRDSASLVQVADFFGAKSIALIELINNDKVDGIHYYGMRYNVWQGGDNTIKDGVYTEYFLRNRNFNQMTLFKIPLLLYFAGLLGMLGCWIALGFLLLKWPPFSWPSVLLALGVSVATIIGLVDYVFLDFLNPLPSDYYATDAGEIWQFSLPAALLLVPLFINYVVLGRLDKHISQYRSRLDEPQGLFILISGSLASIPLIWTNYRIMRFGIESNTWVIGGYSLILFTAYAFALSRWVHKIMDFPQKVDPRRRVLSYAVTALLVYGLYAETAELVVGGTVSVNEWKLLVLLLLPLALEKLYHRIPARSLEPVVPDEFRPVNLEHLHLDEGRWNYRSKTASLLLVQSSNSLNAANYLVAVAQPHKRDWHIVDFSQRGDGKVHYFPFAHAFEHLFTYKRFNDVTEQSRIIGNLLGKLINTVSSIGDYLIDESDPKPRNPQEVAAMIAQTLASTSYGLIFQHPERAAEEDLELMDVLLELLVVQEASTPVAFCEGGAYSLQQRFQQALHKFSTNAGDEPVRFPLAFKNLAAAVLANRNIDPTSRVLIEERLVASELDQSPALAKRAVDDLLSSGQVFTNEYGRIQLKSPLFEFHAELEKFAGLADLDQELRAVVESAAMASNELGVFNLDLVTALAERPRKEVLAALQTLQDRHLIIDLQDDAHVDLYRFADIDTLKTLRQEDEHEKHNLSQSTREYYRSYIRFFLPHEAWDPSQKHLEHCLATGLVSERELTLLAARVLRVGGIGFTEDFLDFVFHKIIAVGATANFHGAQQLILRYQANQKKLSQALSDSLAWHAFVLHVETGNYLEARALYEAGIRTRAEQNTLSSSERLVCVRYCFGDIMHADLAAHGKALNDALLTDPAVPELDRLRAQFYTVKLIFNRTKSLETADNLPNVQHVLHTYQSLLQALTEKTAPLQGKYDWDDNGHAAVALLKEVLNDHLGYFADSLLPYQDHLAWIQMDATTAWDRVQQLKTKRFTWERTIDGDNWLDPSWIQRGTSTDYRSLCFTYNFLQRCAYQLNQFDESIKIGQLSFTLNSFIGDHNGKQLCAGFISKAHGAQGKTQEALYWAEQSVAYAHTHGLYAVYPLTTLAEACASAADFSSFRQLSRLISERHTLKHFDDAMPAAQKKGLLLTGPELLAAQTEKGSRFFWGQPVDFDFLQSLVEALKSSMPLKEGTSLTVNDQRIQIDRVKIFTTHKTDVHPAVEVVSKLELNLTFTSSIGTTHVVPIGPEHHPLEEMRGESKVWVLKGVEPAKTTSCSLIIQVIQPENQWHLTTAHPGTLAPPLPKPTYTGAGSAESIEYWKQHAFIE